MGAADIYTCVCVCVCVFVHLYACDECVDIVTAEVVEGTFFAKHSALACRKLLQAQQDSVPKT
jgi:hypothetical protein